MDINRDLYEKELAEQQERHLKNITNRQNTNWRPCIHDTCKECYGTGIKYNGMRCVHMISCPCPKCTPYFL